MKKITLSIGLLAGILSSNAQDTTCFYFSKKRVIEFDYYKSEILKDTLQTEKYFDIIIGSNTVLCLDLNDEKNRLRKVISTCNDGNTQVDIFNSKDNVYYSPEGIVKVSVGRPRILFLGCK